MNYISTISLNSFTLCLGMIVYLILLIDIRKNYKKFLVTSFLGIFLGLILTMMILVDYPQGGIPFGFFLIASSIIIVNTAIFRKDLIPYISEHILVITSILIIVASIITTGYISIILSIILILFASTIIYILVGKNSISDKERKIFYKGFLVVIPILIVFQLPEILTSLELNTTINSFNLFIKGYLFTCVISYINSLIYFMEIYRHHESTKEMEVRINKNTQLILNNFSDKQITFKEFFILSILITGVVFLNKKFQLTSDLSLISTIFFLGITRNQFLLKKKDIVIS